MADIKLSLFSLMVFITLSINSGYSGSIHFTENDRKTINKPEKVPNVFHLFLSVSDRQTILHYTGNAETGKLSLTDSTRVSGSCGTLAVSPDKPFLYAAVRSEKSIATFSINNSDGSLHFISSIKSRRKPGLSKL